MVTADSSGSRLALLNQGIIYVLFFLAHWQYSLLILIAFFLRVQARGSCERIGDSRGWTYRYYSQRVFSADSCSRVWRRWFQNFGPYPTFLQLHGSKAIQAIDFIWRLILVVAFCCPYVFLSIRVSYPFFLSFSCLKHSTCILWLPWNLGEGKKP